MSAITKELFEILSEIASQVDRLTEHIDNDVMVEMIDTKLIELQALCVYGVQVDAINAAYLVE